MKNYQKILIFMILLSYINSKCNSVLNEKNGDTLLDILDFGDNYTFKDNDASTSKCDDRDFSDYEKKNLEPHKCCYVTANCELDDEVLDIHEKYDVKGCVTVTKSIYNSLGNYNSVRKSACKNYNLECNSSYLKIMLISLILILL